MKRDDLKPNIVVTGVFAEEPVEINFCQSMGNAIKLFGAGQQTGRAYQQVLNEEQINQLVLLSSNPTFDGDALRFRLGVEALRLGFAYEYDPYFSLSISRVDPLPHQLEAVYEYFLKLPRIRFLLADDPGAGKTIMAGLLIKELKIRGLARRILIITPANLTFQWQRELKEKFRETFEVMRGDVLRANYGTNPWQERDQLVTSVSWVSRIEDAKESLMRSTWDLVIVDEAHKLSAANPENKTLAYQLGEELEKKTDHFLLMTATPHKGDPEHFCLFLRLLDPDVYGDVKSMDEAIARKEAPFYLRRVKEALRSFPDPETGTQKQLFTQRHVKTTAFEISSAELDFYEALTHYVEDQSIKASSDNSARGRALGFTMAMLQRRFSSSLFAVRRSLERMRDKREKILKDPEAFRRQKIEDQLPEDFDDLTEEEQQKILDDLEGVVVSADPVRLKEEIIELTKLIDHACHLEKQEVETKLTMLKQVITDNGMFSDPKMKLLLFTEHKDTLTYLVEKLKEWGLSVTQIHGGMKVGSRDEEGTRIWAEKEFRENCKVMVATEAAGEGINLQFCWFMINYDIPWNPVRLEQRMGRIHRYGQEKDCLIFNFVSTNTREGRVLDKLFERIRKIEDDLDPQRTGKVFNVLGEVFPANYLERMVRDMYARNLTEDVIKERIVQAVNVEEFKKITASTLEGLAKRDLNLSAIIGKHAEAKEKRLVPEVIEDFFKEASSVADLGMKEVRPESHVYNVGRIPRALQPIGERLETRFGKLGREYKKIVFDKEILKKDATLEWVTPGHPLFESVRALVQDRVAPDLRQGAIYFDLNTENSYHLFVYSAAVKDGRGRTLHEKLFIVEVRSDGTMATRQPTVFFELIPDREKKGTVSDSSSPDRQTAEQFLCENELDHFLKAIRVEREKETDTISRHLEISLNELIKNQQVRVAELLEKPNDQLHAANMKTTEDRLDVLNNRLSNRRKELKSERQCSVGDIRLIGTAIILPHPERKSPGMVMMVRDDEIERIAVEAVKEFEEARGYKVESVESDNRGFDLISRKPHPEDPQTCIDVRFIEVKGRAKVGEVALSSNEYRTAERLKQDYWLYAVFNCGTSPEVHVVQDPVRLGWEPIVKIEHYHVGADKILQGEK